MQHHNLGRYIHFVLVQLKNALKKNKNNKYETLFLSIYDIFLLYCTNKK